MAKRPNVVGTIAVTARDACGCRYLPKCQHLWGQCVESPMFAALVHETLLRQGWGPSFAMVWLDIPAMWHRTKPAWADPT